MRRGVKRNARIFQSSGFNGQQLLQHGVLQRRRTIVIGKVNRACLVRIETLISVIAGQREQRVRVRVAIGVEARRRVADCVATGHRILGSLPRGIAERFKRRREIPGAVCIRGELLLKRADRFQSFALSGWLGIVDL